MQNSRWTDGKPTAGILAAGIAAIVVLACPGTARAQDWTGPAWETTEAPPLPTLELTVYGGALFPMSMLGSQGDTLRAELSTKPAFAASVEYWIGGGFGIGVMGGLASPDLSMTAFDTDSEQQVSTDLGSTDFLHAEALILWRPELGGSARVLLPYFGVGAGIRRLDFEDGSGFEDLTDPVLVLNAGTQTRISDRVHFRLDVRDLVSSFEGGPFEDSDVQHDVLAQVGFGIGL